ncbi:DNA-directed RNA polymerase, partial [Tuber borchii]
MSSRSLGGGSSTRGSANYSTSVRLDDNVPANVIVRAGKNLREAIDPTEEFLLPAGEKRVVMKCDKNDPTTAIFTFNRDGQTLGGLLVSALLALPCVTFAAYKVSHPLFFVFELRLTTDGAMSPKEALLEASKNMVEDLVMLGRRFTHEWELLKQAEMAGGVGNG